MIAAVCEVFGKPLVLKKSPPLTGAREVLIQVHGCGVCHNDLHLVDGDWASWEPPSDHPRPRGDRDRGRKVGEGGRFRRGRPRGVPWMQYACGRCAPCRTGRRCCARRSGDTGVTVNGGYASFVSAPGRSSQDPDALDLVDAAPLLCAGSPCSHPSGARETSPGRPWRWPASGAGTPRRPDGGRHGLHVVAIVRGPGRRK
jgi:propanol-preferring alcohol dehydrogenase